MPLSEINLLFFSLYPWWLHENRRSQTVPVSNTELQSFIPDTTPILSEGEDADDSDSGVGESTNLTRPALSTHQSRQHPGTRRRISHGHSDGGMSDLTDLQQQKKNLLQVALLEAGILFHSVFIGMALSVATGSNFMVLFVAILFHRKSTIFLYLISIKCA